MVKRIFNFIMVAASAAAFLASCSAGGAKVTVTNDSELDRINETVEIDFADLLESHPDLTAENVTVYNAKGVQIPSQFYQEMDGKSVLLFQATVPTGTSAYYTIKAGEREDFPVMAYSRYVPERLDDYAYENNMIAGRVYGPALSDPRTFGPDVWLKCTDKIDPDQQIKRFDLF